jgi:hypothetical protein
MTYFADLTDYGYYTKEFDRPGTKNVGWLDGVHPFDTAPPSEELLEALWQFCGISIDEMRGVHKCEICNDPQAFVAERGGELMRLGAAEIRAFGDDGAIFAAPTLTFHYVERHHYRPPAAFVAAVLGGPAPPDPGYFARLEALAIPWRKTIRPSRR